MTRIVINSFIRAINSYYLSFGYCPDNIYMSIKKKIISTIKRQKFILRVWYNCFFFHRVTPLFNHFVSMCLFVPLYKDD